MDLLGHSLGPRTHWRLIGEIRVSGGPVEKQFLAGVESRVCGPGVDRSQTYVFMASMRRVTNSHAGTSTCVPSRSRGCSRRLLRQIRIGVSSVHVKLVSRLSPAAPKSRTIHAAPSALRLHSCRSTSSWSIRSLSAIGDRRPRAEETRGCDITVAKRLAAAGL